MVGVKRGYTQSPEHVRRRMAARLRTLATKDPPVTKEWLQSRYWGQLMTCPQIALEAKCDPKTIWAWMRRYGIQTRPRGGESSTGSFRPGQPNAFAGRKHSEETRQKLRAIAIADGRVPFDPVIGPPMRGKTGAETPNWKGGITPERQAFYATFEWREAVKAVWRRAKARCERCSRHHNVAEHRGTFHIHHIASFAVRHLRAKPSNLALLCKDCHMFVHSKVNLSNEFRRHA